MKNSIMYFNFHHPHIFFPKEEAWQEKENNKKIFEKNAREKYTPTLESILKTTKKNPDFNVGLVFSGQFLEHGQSQFPEIIEKISELKENSENQIELITRPYHNTLSMFFGDEEEFIEQVSTQRSLLRKNFGVESRSFRPVSRFFNTRLANQIEDMGMEFIYADLPKKNFLPFYSTKKGTIIISRNKQASTSFMSLSPEDLVAKMKKEENYNLGIPINKIEPSGLEEYLAEFIIKSEKEGIKFTLPEETKRAGRIVQIPFIPYQDISSCQNWEEAKKMSGGVIRSEIEFEFAQQLEKMYSNARKVGNGQLEKWREIANLDTFDSFHNPCKGGFKDEKSAVFYLTRKIDNLDSKLKSNVNIIDRKRKPSVIFITPEIAGIPQEYGEIAQNVKSGVAGLGVFASNLSRGLKNQGINFHIVSPNMPKKFRQESGKSLDDLTAEMFHIPHGNVHLVNSGVFSDKNNPYDGSGEENILAFNSAIKDQQIIEKIRNISEGPVIIHGNDNMPTPTIMRMAAINDLLIQRGEKPLPLLHTIHNVHSNKLNFESIANLGITPEKAYFIGDKVDTQISAIMDSWITNTVSQTWLEEIANRSYPDVIPKELQEQVKNKKDYGVGRAILNCPSPEDYPENIDFLKNPGQYFPGLEKIISSFGPETNNLLEIKRQNLVAFQKLSGLEENPEAILAVYCARMDRFQKGGHFIFEQINDLTQKHQNSKRPLQVALITKPLENDPQLNHQSLTNLALSSNGRITYQLFDKQKEVLSNAGASFVFGPSRFEPCGQNDQIGLLYGAFGLFTDRGGYHDKIEPLRLASNGATHDHGNGFLHPYTSEGFRNGMEQAYSLISDISKNPEELEKNQRRIMEEARDKFSIGKMSGKYLSLYEELAKKVLD